MLKLLRVVFIFLLLLYGVVLNTYLTAYVVCQDCHPLVEQINHMAHWVTLSGLLLLPLAVLAWRWLGLVYVPPITAFILWYGGLFLPAPKPDSQGIEVTAVTYNVLGFIADPNETFAVVKAMDADMVGFQELRPTLRGKLETELSAEYPYQVFKVVQGYEGMGLVSRFPILESEIVFEDDLNQIDLSRLRYLRAVVDIEGQHIVVYVFHPTVPFFQVGQAYDDELNRVNVQAMVEKLKGETLPILLLCDCNTTPRTPQYIWLDDILDDAFKAVGWGFGSTHPTGGYNPPDHAIIRIDYIWYSKEFTPLAAKVWNTSGTSDHYPVWAKLVLKPPATAQP